MSDEPIEDMELLQIARELAAQSIDEEIAHHPSLLPRRSVLLETKAKHLAAEMQEKNDTLVKELNRASDLIKERLQSLPPAESEHLLEQISKMNLSGPRDPNKTLQENLGLSSEVVRAIYDGAIDLQKKENHADASALLKFLITLNPGIPDIWVALGYSQLGLEQYEEALKSFKQSIENDPENPRGYYFTGFTFRLLNDANLSVEQFEEGLKLCNNPVYSDWEPVLKEALNELKTAKEGV